MKGMRINCLPELYPSPYVLIVFSSFCASIRKMLQELPFLHFELT